MYETMVYWEAADEQAEHLREYAEIWRAADKVVYSRTLDSVAGARTRIERELDTEAVRRPKAEGDVSVGGPKLAGQAFAAGLIDECHLFLTPVTVGAGKPALPGGLRLELHDERRFRSGVVYPRYSSRDQA